MCRPFGDLAKVARAYFCPVERDSANREKSWVKCYEFFQDYHAKPREQQEKETELASLHLGFYLASWGMFRGSGPLIHKDSSIYKGVIDVLLAKEYRQLWGQEFIQGLLTCENAILPHDPGVGLIFDMADRIRDYFSQLVIIKGPDKHREHARCSDTLVTKILMGTLACTPAYDTNFCTGLRSEGNANVCASFSKNCLAQLMNLCRENRLWQALKDNPLPHAADAYPPMRVVDLYFWHKGYKRNQEDKSRSASA